MSRPFIYHTTSLLADTDAVLEVTQNAEPVTLEEVREHCRTPIIEQHVGYTPENPMSKDPQVRFWKSLYLGQPCYCIDKQGVLYIFVKP